MKYFVLLLTLSVGMALSAIAQDTSSGSNPGSNSTTTQSSTTTTTTQSSRSDQASDMGKASKSTKEHQLTGCVSGPDANGDYTLTNGHHKKGVELTGSDELKQHVGHEVRIAGNWTRESAAKEQSETKAESGEEKTSARPERVFQVSNITMVSDTCRAASAPGKHHKSTTDQTGAGTPPPSL
jgi:hypothetical protein